MPRLNGKSSHGSKPITSLSRTLSWMPHCWPQKQQCVCTSRSGSALVDSRAPVARDRCGPNRSMICSSLTGSVAMMFFGSGLLPQRALRETEQRAAAAWTDLLVMGRRVRLRRNPPYAELVREAEVVLDGDQISHHHRGRVRLAAAGARRRTRCRAGILVEADAELRRPLKDVEELAEWQPQQREDDGDRVEDGEERVG